MKNCYQPKHLQKAKPAQQGAHIADVPAEEEKVHPLGIPIEDGAGEFVPVPGDTRAGIIAPNGAVVRNPWSQQPQIKPDHAYTDEQEDQDLLIM